MKFRYARIVARSQLQGKLLGGPCHVNGGPLIRLSKQPKLIAKQGTATWARGSRRSQFPDLRHRTFPRFRGAKSALLSKDGFYRMADSHLDTSILSDPLFRSLGLCLAVLDLSSCQSLKF